MINIDKSTLIDLKVDHDHFVQLASIVGYRTYIWSMTYLGLSPYDSILKPPNFRDLVM